MEKNNFVEHGTGGSNGKKNISSQKNPRLPGEVSHTLHPCRELTGVIHGCKIPRTQRGWFLIQPHEHAAQKKICFAKSGSANFWVLPWSFQSFRFWLGILFGDVTIIHNNSKVENWRSLQPNHVVTSQTLNFHAPCRSDPLFFCRVQKKNSTLSFPWFFFPIPSGPLGFQDLWGPGVPNAWRAIMRMLPSTEHKRRPRHVGRWTWSSQGIMKLGCPFFCLFQYQVYLFLFRYRQYVKHVCIYMYKYSECTAGIFQHTFWMSLVEPPNKTSVSDIPKSTKTAAIGDSVQWKCLKLSNSWYFVLPEPLQDFIHQHVRQV